MNSENLSEMKVSEKMEALKAKILDEVKHDILARGEKSPTEEELNQKIKVKYLGKMEFLNEKGELAEKDVFIVKEQLGGMFENLYYDEDLKLLGVQQMIGKEIYPTEYMLGKIPEKMKELTEEDIEKAKNIEEQKEEEQRQGKEQSQAEKQHLQLTQKQVNSLPGPRINLNDFVDNNVTLSQKMGIQGEHIQFVDIDKLKGMDIPGFKAPAELGQRFMPIAIASNGTATVVGEDKLKFSTLEGGNATIERDSMNSDGAEKQEQGIVTFNIPGTNNAITIHWDDELGTSSPFYEASFLTRAPDNKGHLDELTNEGHLKKDNKAHMECIWNTEGEYEGIIEVDRVTVTEELAKKYAEIRDYQKYDAEGNPTLDIEKARTELEARAEAMKESTRGSDREEKPSIYGFVKQAQREKEERNADAKELGPSDTRRPY